MLLVQTPGRLGPTSDEIINRNSCFEVVFNSVLKSDFFSSAPRGAVTRFDILMYTYRCIHTDLYIQMYTYRCIHTDVYIHMYTYRSIRTDIYIQCAFDPKSGPALGKPRGFQ